MRAGSPDLTELMRVLREEHAAELRALRCQLSIVNRENHLLRQNNKRKAERIVALETQSSAKAL